MAYKINSKMCKADYWIQKSKNPDRVIMTQKEIKKFNNAGRDYIKEVKNKRNLIPAVVISRTNLKKYPIKEISAYSDGDIFFDKFQCCELYFNEPVLIVKKSNDEKWYFVICRYYRGWAEADCIALCKTWHEFYNIINCKSFLTVTGDEIFTNINPYSPKTSDMRFAMGTKLPLANKNEYGKYIDNRYVACNYVLKLPLKNKEGFLEYKFALLPFGSDVCMGFLPYTAKNVLRLCFKRLGSIYGWGGMYNSQDCSGYVKYVYACFGLNLPRNAKSTANLKPCSRDVSKMTKRQKYKILNKLPVGSFLYYKGHIAIYIGKKGKKHYAISAVGTIGFKNKHSLERPRTVIINSLNSYNRYGKKWIKDISKVITIAPK